MATVLEVLNGYLILANNLNKKNKLNGKHLIWSKNFQNKKVIDVLNEIKKFLPNFNWKIDGTKKFKESKLLKLNSSKAKKYLKWTNKLSFSNILR